MASSSIAELLLNDRRLFIQLDWPRSGKRCNFLSANGDCRTRTQAGSFIGVSGFAISESRKPFLTTQPFELIRRLVRLIKSKPRQLLGSCREHRGCPIPVRKVDCNGLHTVEV